MTILFDLDGTLTDSGEGIIKSSAMVLEKYGLPVPSFEEMRVFVGPPLHETFHKFGIPEDQCDAAVELYRTRYNTVGKFENFPYPGIRQLLEKLKDPAFRAEVKGDMISPAVPYDNFYRNCGSFENVLVVTCLKTPDDTQNCGS